MCCPLDKTPIRFEASSYSNIAEKHTGCTGNHSHDHEEKIVIEGTLIYAPQNLSDRITRMFQRMELLEKIAEIVDETFHLLSKVLKAYTSIPVFEFLQNLHEGAHHIEHTLHSFCFIGDIARIFTGKFVEYQNKEATEDQRKVDYIRTAARVLHTASHFFSSAEFLIDLKICKLSAVEPLIKYKGLLSASGYALWTGSVLWRYFKPLNFLQDRKNIVSDLMIHVGGGLFEGLSVAKKWKPLANVSTYIAKTAATAGIIHAYSVVNRLTPEQEELKITINKDDILDLYKK
ncbi:MAG: hypothetical protein H0W88_10810 [Parachlamydiaceae bacterium]|nr:hypothetical protein [Parachlamydiaceae bacterium]